MGTLRVLLAKVGLDGHDRGIKLIARALMEAGLEVIYTGLRSTPEQVVKAALEEDVDVLGLSFLAGDHMILVPRVIEALRRSGAQDIKVIVGGIILARDIASLEQAGVSKVFRPGTPPEQIVQFIRSLEPVCEP